MNAKCGWCCDATNNLTEVFVGEDAAEEEKKFICPQCLRRAERDGELGFCRCCGESTAYFADDLDEKSLCAEHKGEFDLDEQEAQDMEDYIENITKDG